MKKLLIQPCVLAIIAISMLSFGCNTTKDGDLKTDLAVHMERVGDAQQTEITIKFTPEQGIAKYVFAIGNPGDVEAFKEDNFPGKQEVSGSVSTTYTFKDLTPNAVYTVFAMAYDSKGEPFGVSQYSVRVIDNDFVVTQYYVTDVSAGFQVKTTSDYIKYTYYLGTAADKENFENNMIEGAKMATETYSYTYNYWDLTPDTEYVFYVKGIDRSGDDTATFEVKIKTASLDSNAIPNITFTPGQMDFYQQTYTVTPNAKCKQIVLRQTTKGYNDSHVADAFAGDFMSMIDAWQDMTIEMMRCYKATDETLIAKPTTPDLELNADLDVYVVIYDDQYEPCGIKKFTPKTPAQNPDALKTGMDVDITLIEAIPEHVKFTVTTGDNARFYLMDIYTEAMFNKVYDTSSYDKMTSFQNDLMSRGNTVIEYDSRSTTFENNETKFTFGDTYYIVVCPTNENGPKGDGFGEVAFQKVVITE